MNITQNLKEMILSILPIIFCVLLLNWTVVSISQTQLLRFLIGSLLIVIGLTFFLLGVEIGIEPLGSLVGSFMARVNKLWVVLILGLLVGFFISIAEPGLLVLAQQVNLVTSGNISTNQILYSVSLGLAILLIIGFLHIFHQIPLSKLLLLLYIIIGGLSFFSSPEFLAIAFDASGATTGILAVPFILSLSVGISKLKKDSKGAEKDSFGLVSIASAGAILAVLCLEIAAGQIDYNRDINLISNPNHVGLLEPFIQEIPQVLTEGFISLLPLLVLLVVGYFFFFKITKTKFYNLLVGFFYAFFGLCLFFIGVNAGFMDIGSLLGQQLVNQPWWLLTGISFILGFTTIMAEPAVYVLTHQVEEVTSGFVRRKLVLFSLAIGVGLAVALSALRILIPEIQLWHYLLPGYILSLGLMFATPKLFVGIAFDAGGVATGPITATFILSFIQGAANAYHASDILIEGFGMIAMVAMMPILVLETLGLIFKIQASKNH